MHTGLDEYPATFKEGAETPTVLSGHGQRESQLVVPFYDVWRYPTIYLVLRTVTH